MLDLSVPEIQFALNAARQAASLARDVRCEMASSSLVKADCSPVTVADFASQALVGYLLSQAFPEDVLVAEESSADLVDVFLGPVADFVAHYAPEATPDLVTGWIDRGQGEFSGAAGTPRFWVLDPVDGTKGFLRGGQYATALALIENGQVQLGALGCPHLVNGYRSDTDGPGSLVIAARGQGAWVTSLAPDWSWNSFERLRVSGRDIPSMARLLRSHEDGHTNAAQVEGLARQLSIMAEPVRMDSQAKFAVLAAGKGDLLVRLLSPEKPDYREKIWDLAAGSIVLEEAGGTITDLDGRLLDFSAGRKLANNRGIVASNGRLHEAALAALKILEA